MSITDELRKWAEGDALRAGMSLRTTRDQALAIADRIDAEHERLMQEQPYTIDMVPMTDECMAEHGWIKLPKDADGVPIHAEDVLMDGKHAYTVTSVAFDTFGAIVYGHSETSLNSWPIDQTGKMHHRQPLTVEDVLTEFAAKLIERGELTNGGAQTIAEYAARLQLKEGA